MSVFNLSHFDGMPVSGFYQVKSPLHTASFKIAQASQYPMNAVHAQREAPRKGVLRVEKISGVQGDEVLKVSGQWQQWAKTMSRLPENASKREVLEDCSEICRDFAEEGITPEDEVYVYHDGNMCKP